MSDDCNGCYGPQSIDPDAPLSITQIRVVRKSRNKFIGARTRNLYPPMPPGSLMVLARADLQHAIENGNVELPSD